MTIPCNMQKKYFKSTINRILRNEVLVLSKEKANQALKEIKMLKFIDKIIENKNITRKELTSFLHALIEDNPFIDLGNYSAPKVYFKNLPEFLVGNAGQGEINISNKHITEVLENLNDKESLEFRLLSLCAMIDTLGHELTHDIQSKRNTQFTFLHRNALFNGNESYNFFSYLSHYKNGDKNCSKFDKELISELLYEIYPHESDARKGGLVFTFHILDQLDAIYAAIGSSHKRKIIESIKELYYEDMQLGEPDKCYVEMVEESMKELCQEIDISKLSQMGLILDKANTHRFNKTDKGFRTLSLSIFNEKKTNEKESKLPAKKELLNMRYEKYIDYIETKNQLYISLLYFSCARNKDDDNFSHNLLARFIEDGNPCIPYLSSMIHYYQKEGYKKMAERINLDEILENGDISLSSLVNLPVYLKPTNPEALAIKYINENKLQYAYVIIVNYSVEMTENLKDTIISKAKQCLESIKNFNMNQTYLYQLCEILEEYSEDGDIEVLLTELKENSIKVPYLSRQNEIEYYSSIYGEKSAEYYFKLFTPYRSSFQEKLTYFQAIDETE